MTEIVRSIKENEFDSCLDLWDQAFERTPRDYFVRYFTGDPWFKPEYTRVYADDSKFLSAVHIVRRVVRVGKTRLVMGGIANVGTPPEYRGKGYSSECLKSSIEVMENDGFDFSMLSTGINPFYERFGWETVPKDYPTGDLKNPLPKSDTGHIVTGHEITGYEPGDAQAVVDVYNAFSRDVVLSVERTREYWEGYCVIDPERIRIARSHDGKIAGYLVKGSHGNMPVAQELVCLPGHEDCLLPLMLEFAKIARLAGASKIAAGLPLTNEISRVLESLLTNEGSITFNNHMMRIINLNRLMEKMLPELSDRASQSGVSGTLAIETSMGVVGLKADSGNVGLFDEKRCDERVRLSQAQFFHYLFGIKEPEKNTLLKTLFPIRPWMYSVCDYF